MTKDIVIVKDYKGQPLVRSVWGVGAKVVYVVNESGDCPAIPIGFPRGDVFLYDDNYLNILKNTNKDIANWGRMLPYDK